MDGFFSKKNETFIAIVYSKRIWLNLLMDDHQFDCIAIFYSKRIWLNLLMDDHQFGYIAVFTAKKIG